MATSHKRVILFSLSSTFATECETCFLAAISIKRNFLFSCSYGIDSSITHTYHFENFLQWLCVGIQVRVLK